jgi:hypothetical protein
VPPLEAGAPRLQVVPAGPSVEQGGSVALLVVEGVVAALAVEAVMTPSTGQHVVSTPSAADVVGGVGLLERSAPDDVVASVPAFDVGSVGSVDDVVS